METVKKNGAKKSIWLLAVILVSYFIVGFPDGAFTVSWLSIRYEPGFEGMTVAHTGYILVGYSITYTLAGVLLSWFNSRMKLQTLYFWGLVIMGAGFVWLALSPNFTMALAAITLYGFGTGLMASSMNSYMAKHYTARENNWMHCSWGGGASLSPIIMGGMIAAFSWRAGYFLITGILAVVGIMLLISMAKKIWIDGDEAEKQDDKRDIVKEEVKKQYLTKKWHQAVEILTFFFLGGTDYTLVFFTGAALIARGTHTFDDVVMFSAVYYIGMTVGRMFFGWTAKWLKEVPIERIGVAISLVGLIIVYFAGNIWGMVLLGIGLGPLLPTLVSDSSNRFTPRILSKIVGLELAAFGAGIAVLFFITSQVMYVTGNYDNLFPLALSFIVLVFICNEILAWALKREQRKGEGAK
ncbi:MAG: MFS transporter [Defluviitaleaceae bacterium]|nr:MFS transporter [Defluviitaleaceae bacterium]